MTAISNNISFAEEEDAEKWFDCDYCAYTFDVYDEYRSHIFTHFNTKHCSECNVKLIRICGDEWFSFHTTSNCQHNKHVDDLSSIGPDNDEDIIPLVIKEEELQSEIDADHLDDLLDVEGDDDVDICDFGQIFAAELSASIGTDENSEIHATFSQQANANRQQSKQNAQFNYKVESIKEKDQTVIEVEHKPRSIGFRCRFCDKKFKSRFQLDSHVQSHHNVENQTRCEHCNENFNSFDQLDIHLRQCPWNNRNRKYERRHPHHPAVGPFTCDICGKKLRRFGSISKHMRVQHLKIKSCKCRLCGQLCPSQFFLAKHRMVHKQAHEKCPKNDNESDVGSIVRPTLNKIHPHRPNSNFICDICGENISSLHSLVQHMSFYHGAADCCKCRLCGRMYPTQHYLKKHMKRHLEAKKLGVPEEQLFEDIDEGLMTKQYFTQRSHGKKYACGRISNDQHDLHQPNSDFNCDTCGMMYNTNAKLMKHMETNHSSKDSLMNKRYLDDSKNDKVHPHWPSSFTCDICQKTVSSYYAIMKHMQLKHMRSRQPVKCPKCERTFVLRKSLEKHILLKHNSQEKNEADVKKKEMCSVCGRFFSYKYKLREHERTHFILQPSCDICGKRFLNKNHLSNHMKTVHEKLRPFHCPVEECNKTFGHSSSIKTHLGRIHGMDSMIKNRNACPICSKEFPGSISNLKRHLKAHANNTAKEYIPDSKIKKKHQKLRSK